MKHLHAKPMSYCGTVLFLLISTLSCQSISQFVSDNDGTSSGTTQGEANQNETECKLIGETIEVQGQIQQAEMHLKPLKKGFSLYYETRTRTGTKSILQPVDSRFRNEEDGISVGDKRLRNIRQFKFNQDDKGQQWISYKAQLKNSELTIGVVEFLPKDSSQNLTRLRLPAKRNESLQDMWILYGKTKGPVVSVVTRFTLNTDAPDTTTYFRWYLWDTQRNTIKINSEQRMSRDVPSQTRFFAMEENLEPFAFAVVSGSNSTQAMVTNSTQEFKITLWRPFLTTPTEIVLSRAKSPLTDLNVELSQQSTNSNWILSWIQEAGTDGAQVLKYRSLPAFAKFQIGATGPEVHLPIEQDSLNLTILQPYLSWWTPAERNRSVVRSLSIQGTNSTITLDAILPKKFTRVLGIGPIFENKVTVVVSKETDFKQIEGGSVLRFCQINLK